MTFFWCDKFVINIVRKICMQASKQASKISKQARSENREQDRQNWEKEGMYKKMMRPSSTEEKGRDKKEQEMDVTRYPR